MGNNDVKMSNNDLLVPECCFAWAVARAGLHIGTWFLFRVIYCKSPRCSRNATQPRFARPQRGGVAGGVVALDIMLPGGARDPPTAAGSSSSSNFTLAYLRQSAFSCPRAPGASCSERKVSRITWTGSFFPVEFLIASCMLVRVANGSINIASSNM